MHFKYEVTQEMVGKTLNWTVSYREGGTTIDLFLFSTSPDLEKNYSEADLDRLLLGGGESGASLAISRNGSQATLSWPVAAAGYVLESAPSLPAGAWTLEPGAVVVVGDQNTVTVDIGPAGRYFRLRKP